MKILVVGGGAREHAFAWKLSRERTVTGIVCAPGNPGIAAVARCVPADPGKPDDLLAIAKREKVDLTVVGPEVPLSRGIVDLFAANHRSIVGPSAAAAALESSKAFAKDFMARHAVPTARFRICDSADAALSEIARGEFGYPLVIKADGLAAGKGVVIAEDRSAAEATIRVSSTTTAGRTREGWVPLHRVRGSRPISSGRSSRRSFGQCSTAWCTKGIRIEDSSTSDSC